jgi:hypothetical protein
MESSHPLQCVLILHDSPAEFTHNPGGHVGNIRDRYVADAKYVEPAPPEPAYCSPSRRANRTPHPSVEMAKYRSERRYSRTSSQGEEIEMRNVRGPRYLPQSPDVEMGRGDRQYRQTNGSGFARASVRSQRALQPLAMQSERSLATEATRWSTVINNAKLYSDPEHTYAEPTLAELQKARFPEHSLAEDRRQWAAARRLCRSLFIFGLFAFPLLIGMGMGGLDGYIKNFTYGRVPYVPAPWKAWSRFAGWGIFCCWLIFIGCIFSYREGLNRAH